MSLVELQMANGQKILVRPEHVCAIREGLLILTNGQQITTIEKLDDVLKKLGVGGENLNLEYFSMRLELSHLTNAPDGKDGEELIAHTKEVLERLVFLADLFVECVDEKGVTISEEVTQKIKEHRQWKGEGDEG